MIADALADPATDEEVDDEAEVGGRAEEEEVTGGGAEFANEAADDAEAERELNIVDIIGFDPNAPRTATTQEPAPTDVNPNEDLPTPHSTQQPVGVVVTETGPVVETTVDLSSHPTVVIQDDDDLLTPPASFVATRCESIQIDPIVKCAVETMLSHVEEDQLFESLLGPFHLKQLHEMGLLDNE